MDITKLKEYNPDPSYNAYECTAYDEGFLAGTEKATPVNPYPRNSQRIASYTYNFDLHHAWHRGSLDGSDYRLRETP